MVCSVGMGATIDNKEEECWMRDDTENSNLTVWGYFRVKYYCDGEPTEIRK